MKKAPNPYFTLKGKSTLAKAVVEINNCRLYIYDENGRPIESFKVANGTPSTPTKAGIRKVIEKQTYPYSNLPKSTKRYRFPADYGPRIAYLNEVDTITGALRDLGAYFHGTRHESSIMPESPKNRLKTHSCTRVHNRDALYVINDVLNIGDFFKFVK